MELMLALLIFSIIALSLYSTFSMATLTERKTNDTNRIYQEARACLDEIASSLKNAIFFDFSKNYPDLKLFDGQADQISFFIADDSGLRKISYSLKKVDFGKVEKVVLGKRGSMPDKIIADYRQIAQRLLTLERKEQDFLSSLSSADAGSQIADLTALVKEEGLKFSYAYKTKTGDSESTEALNWRDNFESPNQIPRIVRITLTLINPKDLKQERTFTKIIFIPTGTLLTSE